MSGPFFSRLSGGDGVRYQISTGWGAHAVRRVSWYDKERVAKLVKLEHTTKRFYQVRQTMYFAFKIICKAII